MLVGTGGNATGVQTHHLLGNVQEATMYDKEARASCFKDGRSLEEPMDDLAAGRVEPLSAHFLKLDVMDLPGRTARTLLNR